MMAWINPKPTTPKPDVRPAPIPRSPLPRAQIIQVDLGNGLEMTGTVAELEAAGYVAQQPPRRLPPTMPEEKQPATGKTTRLPGRCRVCGDELPPYARYCIECGATVK